MSSALATLRFLSRIPVAGNSSSDLEKIHAGWFPVAGLVIGALIALTDLALGSMQWEVRNALVVLVGVVITGALHLDALMDAADGLAAPRGESSSAIHTSVHSAAGAATGMIALILGWLALCQINDPARTQWLLWAPVLGRTAIIMGYQAFRPGSNAGPVTQSLASSARAPLTVGAILLAMLACVFSNPWITLAPLILAFIIATTVALTFRWRNDELGGDHYGALAVVSELSFLMGAAVLSPVFAH